MGWIPSNDAPRNEALAAFCDGVIRTRELVDQVMGGAKMSATVSVPANKGIWKKLAAVMGKVDRIPKNGRNTFHNYDYATEADITEAVRGIMAAEGIAFMPSVVSWERGERDAKGNALTRVQMEFTLADTESGETIVSTFWGEGQDNMDKGFYKAYTGAVKYFLLKTLLIPTGDDPEEAGGQQQHTQQRQQQQDSRKKPLPEDYRKKVIQPAQSAPKLVAPELVGSTVARAVDAGLTLDNLVEFVKSSIRQVKDLTELTPQEFEKVTLAVDTYIANSKKQEG